MKQAIHHLRTSDPVLSAIIEQVGEYGIQFRPADFETLVKSIVFQQLSGRVANVIFGRLSAAVKGVVTPESVLKLRPSRMRSLGLSTQKVAYIRDLARHTRSGKVVFQDLAALADDEVIQRLTEVKGIGVWTAHMFLMFALQRTDILPTGDLGLRNAIRKAYHLEALPTAEEMERMAGRWRPRRCATLQRCYTPPWRKPIVSAS